MLNKEKKEENDFNFIYTVFPPKTKEEAMKKKFNFWNTQPVPKLDEVVNAEGPISVKTEKVSNEPHKLPNTFKWKDIDVNNAEDITKLTKFIQNNYVEETDFKKFYSQDFLTWILKTPGSFSKCIRGNNDKETIVGFVHATSVNNVVSSVKLDMATINFLTVHKKLRGKRMAPVLIQEITRCAQLKDIWSADYTAENYLPSPFSTIHYYHYPINYDKLLDVGFCHLEDVSKASREQVLDVTKKRYEIMEEVDEGFEELREEDASETCEVLNDYLSRYNFHRNYTEKEFKHLFLGGYVKTFVFKDKTGVRDMVSYYWVDSKHKKTKTQVKECYLFMYTSKETTLLKLLRNLLVKAKEDNMDVFNITDVMENEKVLIDMFFLEGTGKLHYYFYNWKIPPLKPNQIAKITM